MDFGSAAINGSSLVSGGAVPIAGMREVINAVMVGNPVQDGLDDIREWFRDNGGTALCFFNDISIWANSGQWGAQEYLGEEKTPWTRLKAWHAANEKWW